jgi:hypothetical protein
MSVPLRRPGTRGPDDPGDPAYWMLERGMRDESWRSKPVVFKEGCYICEDPEFALMGLPLCRKCPQCEGHIPADDMVCDDCGYEEIPPDAR